MCIFSHNNVPASKILRVRNVEKHVLFFVEKIIIFWNSIFMVSRGKYSRKLFPLILWDMTLCLGSLFSDAAKQRNYFIIKDLDALKKVPMCLLH